MTSFYDTLSRFYAACALYERARAAVKKNFKLWERPLWPSTSVRMQRYMAVSRFVNTAHRRALEEFEILQKIARQKGQFEMCDWYNQFPISRS